jgi:hypothetical protein
MWMPPVAENVTFGIGYAPRCPASGPDTSTILVVLRSGQRQLPDGCTAAGPQAQAEDAILHGLNDWSRINGHLLWIVVTVVSGILFLGYAKVGSRGDAEAPGSWTPASPADGAMGPLPSPKD